MEAVSIAADSELTKKQNSASSSEGIHYKNTIYYRYFRINLM